MINLISRKNIFESTRNITAEISHIQNIMFDDYPELFESDQDRIEYVRTFDAKDLQEEKLNRFYKVISFEHSEIETFVSKLTDILLKLLTDLGVSKIIVISYLKRIFFGANLKHNYAPIKTAYKKLESITKNRSYDEAFIIGREDLIKFIEIFFWIERCDASAPEFIFFHDEKDRFSFYLCKDGNIHTIEFNEEILTSTVLVNNNLYQVEGRCQDKFRDGKIEGRITASGE